MKHYPLKQVLCFIAMLWFGNISFAQTTYTVNAGGTGDYLTISDAILNATGGDIILVEGTITGDGSGQDGILVNKNLSIIGQGTALTTVEASTIESDAGINQRVFTIAAGVTATIKNMTVRHGYLNTAVNYDGGGGIKNMGTLFLDNCVLEKNHVHTQTYQFGGGLLTADTGSTTINNCTIKNNTSSGWAGGICHGNYGGPGALVLTNSTLENNSAPGRAGALLIMICTQNNIITNCTFFNNTSGSYGVLFNDRSSATYTNNTFYGNTCTGGGGAIYLYAGTMNMKNNLLANNNESGGSVANDFRYQSGTVNDNGNNLIEFSANYTFTGSGDITGDQPSLNVSGTLADNGTFNSTQTLALLASSVAIDAGSTGSNGSVLVPCSDQRGYYSNATKDIGAYEYNGLTTVPYTINIETDPTGQTACVGNAVSFSVGSSNGVFYQWYKDGIEIPGANSSTLSLSSITLASAGSYYCKVSDGCVSADSNPAELVVYSTTGCVTPTGILDVDPASFTGTIAPSTNVFVSSMLNPLGCYSAEVSFLGVEIDASSAGGGSFKLGLYDGNTLIYETNPLSVTGGIDELVGEMIPAGTLILNGTSSYKIGLIYAGPDFIYLKTTNAPVYNGIAQFTSATSYFNTTTTYPTLPDPYSITGAWGFDIAFNIQGVVTTTNTAASISITDCDSYTSPSGQYTWTSSGIYMDTIPNAAGCDSVLTIDLTLNYSTSATDVITACDSYTWIDNNTYTASNNTATHIIPNAIGCDSVITLDLTINYSTSATDVITACDSYTWIDNNTYTASNNTATHIIPNAAGCDSVITLDLTINYSTSATDVITACDSYTWIDNNTYTASNNTATHTIPNAAGCDSVITLDLTINYSTSATDVITACDSYTWIDNNTYTASNNTATHIIPNAIGCDSVITLDLTINYSTSATDVITACDSYTWIDNNTYTASNNTATHTIPNAAGCDSVITLDLTINYSTSATDVITACDSYTWIDNNTYTASNNTATHTIPNAAGCDSVITLDLTINYSTSATDAITACGSYTWIDGNVYTSSNNTAMYTIPNAVGCDSVITLDLTINTVDVTTSVSDITISSNAGNATYQWLDCSNNMAVIAGETGQSFTPAANGMYAVEVSENGCIDTSDCVTISSVGIAESKLNDQLVLYPNPNQGKFTILFDQMQEEVTVELQTITGQLIDATNYVNAKELSISISEPSGTYLVVIRNPQGENRIIRVVKE